MKDIRKAFEEGYEITKHVPASELMEMYTIAAERSRSHGAAGGVDLFEMLAVGYSVGVIAGIESVKGK